MPEPEKPFSSEKESEKENSREQLYPTMAVYTLLTALVVILFTALCFHFDKVAVLLQNTFSVLKPILYALFFAFLILPLNRILYSAVSILTERKKPKEKTKRALALLFTYLIVAVAIVIFVATIIPQTASGYNDLSAKAPDYIRSARQWLDDTLNDFDFLHTFINIPRDHAAFDPETIVPLSYQVPQLSVADKLNNPLFTTLRAMRRNSLTIDVSGMLNSLLSNSFVVLDKAFPYVWAFFGNLLTEIKNILIGLIISVYILASRRYLTAQVRKLCAALFPSAVNGKLAHIGEATSRILGSYLSGKLLDSLVVGLMCCGGMYLLRLPYPMLISVMVGVVNFIPFVGPIIGGVAGALIVFIISPVKALWFLILIVVGQQIDGNLIEPHIMKQRMGLPPLLVICCVLIMGGFFGGVGLFFGVPVFAVFYTLIGEWVNRRLEERQLCAEAWSVPEEPRETEETPKRKSLWKRLYGVLGTRGRHTPKH